MHRRATFVSVFAVAVFALVASACNKSSKTNATGATTTTAKSSGVSTFTIPKTTFPPGQDPCKLSDADVSAAVGFTVHRTTPPNDMSCLYVASDEIGAPSVYILRRVGTEAAAKSDSVFSLGGAKPATVTDVSGFKGWAFTALQEHHDTVDGGVELDGGAYFSTRIRVESPGSPDLPNRSVALLHKLVA